ncbi:hypothetical protein BS47DRAFT_194993 [Hydnum rufescens UP504]|uniref:Protein kinase domain-containing protein n=1 Tax=Hydnum rufescens UP504 TaxID=1448309 RepID=A0A9P6B7N4_9AGAM|nr:hypothetical protein BS47DRAFT_194993 [Hydnum rufescens UP504]
MAECSRSHLSEVRQEIDALFAWNPPVIRAIASPFSKRPSTGTHPPAFYDKHLAQQLVLKQVKRLPSLVQQLAANVDKALGNAFESLPPLEDFITSEARRMSLKYQDPTVFDEKGVVSYYEKITSTFCVPLASTLALHPKASVWDSLLEWSASTRSPGRAIMNGVLRFREIAHDEESKSTQELLLKNMDNETRRAFEDLSKSVSPLATWEMKSLFAAPKEVVTAICNLDRFTWTSCQKVLCKVPEHKRMRERAEPARAGPDAKNPSWDLKDVSYPPAAPAEPLGQALSSTSAMPPPMQAVSMVPSAKEKGKGKAKAETEDRGADEGKASRKRQKRDRDDAAYQDPHDRTAEKVVQQAWAQAVRDDGTVIVLHSGNYELVCLRHRASQTLYVSDLIEPHTCANPGYGKVQVGIYVAAVEDAINRRKQQPYAESQDTPPDDDEDRFDIDDNNDKGPRRGRRSDRGPRGGRRGDSNVRSRGPGRRGGSQRRGETRNDDADAAAVDKLIQVASIAENTLVQLHYSIYDSPVPASFVRSSPPILANMESLAPPDSPRAISTGRLGECLFIILTSEIGQGATGLVHRGTLNFDIPGVSGAIDVIVKFAFELEQQDALRAEHEVYRLLRSKGILTGIATTLGIFDDCEGMANALIMVYAGVSLSQGPHCILSASDCDLALSTLELIHNAGLLHGDIREENILVSDLGITIIDFAYSKQCRDRKAMNKEYRLLQYILGKQRHGGAYHTPMESYT